VGDAAMSRAEEVRCRRPADLPLEPEVQIECHRGYEPTETDRHDAQLLPQRFNLPLPRRYQD